MLFSLDDDDDDAEYCCDNSSWSSATALSTSALSLPVIITLSLYTNRCSLANALPTPLLPPVMTTLSGLGGGRHRKKRLYRLSRVNVPPSAAPIAAGLYGSCIPVVDSWTAV